MMKSRRLEHKYTQYTQAVVKKEQWTFYNTNKNIFLYHIMQACVWLRLCLFGCRAVFHASGETRYEDFEAFLFHKALERETPARLNFFPYERDHSYFDVATAE